MGELKDCTYYDDIYLIRHGYSVKYTQSEYYMLWLEVCKLLSKVYKKNDIILEIGCGSGQFANMLFDLSYYNYIGIDFSKIAIEKAKIINPNMLFKCVDVINDDIKNISYDIVICLETLEHLDDIKLLDKLKQNTYLLFTVPDFNDPAHVRYFSSVNEIITRYTHKILFDTIDKFGKYFICSGRVK